jgi:hypothetical protein
MELFEEYAEAMTSDPGMPAGFRAMMKTMMSGSVLVGIVFSVGWGVAKLVFLAWAHRYAGTPEVVAHFERDV